MHRPPAVSHGVDRSRWHAGLIAALATLCVVSCAVLGTTLSSHATQLAIGSITGVAIALAFSNWKNTSTGRLQWDGQHWRWSGFGEIGVREVRLVLDFQRVLLVRVCGEDGTCVWLWLETRSADRHWLSLRRAIVAGLPQVVASGEPDDLYGSGAKVVGGRGVVL